jgi:hypothetical protein
LGLGRLGLISEGVLKVMIQTLRLARRGWGWWRRLAREIVCCG